MGTPIATNTIARVNGVSEGRRDMGHRGHVMDDDGQGPGR